MGLPDPNSFLGLNNDGPDPSDYTPENVSGLQGPNPLDYVFDAGPDNIEQGAPILNSPEAIDNSIMNMRNFSQGSTINPYQLGKTNLFGAGIEHHQYERYYEHPKFDELGFSPFRDNETFYNANSNTWDDFRRAFGEWGTLFKLGFVDAMGFGDLTDRDNARTYEKAMAIGQSSREGAGAFATNLFLNSGYTFGIMGELAAEELLLLGATALTGGLSAPATGAAAAARAGKAMWKLRNAWRMGANVTKALANLKDVNKARMYFKNAAQATGRFLNPLEQTTQFFRSADKFKDLNNFAKTTAGFGAFYRDIRNLRLVYGESALEGGMVQNQMESELLAEHYKKHNRPPTDAEAKVIRDTAAQAGISTSLWNMPVIYFSNKIVFDNMFKAFNPVNKLTKDIIETGAGRIVRTAAKEAPYQVMKRGFSGFIQGVKNPRMYARHGLNYFKANFAEGLQETAQEVISGSAMDYYKDNMHSTVRGGYYAAIGDNIVKQFSSEGAEIFLSGFLMGGLVQPVTSGVGAIPSSVKMGFSRIKNREQYDQLKETRKNYVNRTVNMLNDMYKDPAKYFAPDLENMIAQDQYSKGMKQAGEKGDVKTYYDLKDASVFQHILTALKTGHLEGFVDRLEAMKDLDPSEVKDAFPGVKDRDSLHRAIDNAVFRARQIETRYNMMNQKFPNPFNPAIYKYGTDEYKEEVNKKISYDMAIGNVMFLQNSFDRALERVNTLQEEVIKDAQLEDVSTSDFNAMFSITASQEKIDQLQKEIAPLQESPTLDKEGRKLLKQKQRKLKLLEEFSQRLDEYLSLGGTMTENERFIRAMEAEEMTEKEKKAELRRIKREEKARGKLHTSYRKYMRGLASLANNHSFDQNLDDSFQKLLDIYQLGYDTTHLVKSINALTDPQGFARHADQMKEVLDIEHNSRKEVIEMSLKAYLSEMKDPNELLIALHKEGMFFDPDQLQALLQDGKIPDKFYYAKGENRLEEVPRNSADFKKAISVISKYVEHIMEMPVPEATSGYESKVRERIKGDSRTYQEYAEQFGFDPEAVQTTVGLKEVLQAIVESPYSTEPEKALARRLAAIAKPGETVTFRKDMSVAGSYDEVSQTTVDARHAASDFEIQGTPLEAIILRQEIQRQLQGSLKGNTPFKGQLQALFDHVVGAEQDSTPEERAAMYNTASMNLLDFAIEAMTNPEYQNQLAAIEYQESEGKSSWTGFVDAVVNMLKELFGREGTTSALNGAIDLITAQIDVTQAEEEIAAAEEEETETGEKPVSRKSSIAEISALPAYGPEGSRILINELVEAYKTHNAMMEESKSAPLDANWKNMSDEAIKSSVKFKIFISSAYSRPKALMDEYNELTGRKVVAKTPTPKTKSTAPVILTTPMKEELKKLGYTEEDIKGFVNNPVGAQRIIDQGMTKEQQDSLKEARMKEAKILEDERAANMREEINNLIDSAKNLKELEEARTKITVLRSDLATFDKTGLTSEDINEMIEAKKNDLAFTVQFDDLRVGEVVIMNDDFNTRMVVDHKGTVEVQLHKVGDPTFVRKVNMVEVPNKIKYRYSEAMEAIDMETEKATDTEKKLMNQDKDTAQDLNNQESIQEDVNAAKNSSREDLLRDMEDDIEDC